MLVLGFLWIFASFIFSCVTSSCCWLWVDINKRVARPRTIQISYKMFYSRFTDWLEYKLEVESENCSNQQDSDKIIWTQITANVVWCVVHSHFISEYKGRSQYIRKNCSHITLRECGINRKNGPFATTYTKACTVVDMIYIFSLNSLMLWSMFNKSTTASLYVCM